MMNPCKLEASYSGNRVEITNKGDKVISALTLECDSSASVFFSDGCCMLLPGEKAEIELEFAGESLPDLFISGFGVPYRKMEL